MKIFIIDFIEKRYKKAVRTEKHLFDAVFTVKGEDHELVFEVFTDKDSKDVFLSVILINEADEFAMYACHAPSDARIANMLFELLRV